MVILARISTKYLNMDRRRELSMAGKGTAEKLRNWKEQAENITRKLNQPHLCQTLSRAEKNRLRENLRNLQDKIRGV